MFIGLEIKIDNTQPHGDRCYHFVRLAVLLVKSLAGLLPDHACSGSESVNPTKRLLQVRLYQAMLPDASAV